MTFLTVALWALVVFQVISALMQVFKIGSGDTKAQYPKATAALFVVFYTPVIAITVWAALVIGTL